MRPAEIAGEVTRRLGLQEHREHLKNPPELPRGERTIRAALSKYAGQLRRDVHLDAVAHDWSKDIPAGADHAIHRAVATRLAMPYFAEALTADGNPLEVNLSAPEFNPPSPDPARKATGF